MGMETREAVFRYNAANLAVDSSFFTANEEIRVTGIHFRVDVAGTDVGAVTGQIRKVPSGTAVASGTVLHSGTINLKSAASTTGVLTLSTTPSDLRLNFGDSLGFDLTGIATAAVGCVTVTFEPIDV